MVGDFVGQAEKLKEYAEEAKLDDLNIGVVTFNGTADERQSFKSITDPKFDIYDVIDDMVDYAMSNMGSGTNIEAGLRKGLEMLENKSKATNDANKFVIFISDGLILRLTRMESSIKSFSKVISRYRPPRIYTMSRQSFPKWIIPTGKPD